MTALTAIVRNGRLELPGPIDLPDGTEVEVRLPESAGTASGAEEGPMTPEEIARPQEAMDKIEPWEMTEEERAALEADRKARKEWEKAHFEERAEKLRRCWE
jgi:acyl-CoA reductase-like NAD-dependent aldehyde dehydrogenase